MINIDRTAIHTHKPDPILPNPTETHHDGTIVGVSHFHGIRQRTQGLLLKTARTPVPKLKRKVGGIQDRRGISTASFAADPQGDRLRIRITGRRDVAKGTTD
jgi:hypothetical protein